MENHDYYFITNIKNLIRKYKEEMLFSENEKEILILKNFIQELEKIISGI